MEKLGQLRAARRVGPDHRRHPAVPLRAGLPGRPQAARLLPGREVHQAADGPGQGRRPGRDEVPELSGMSMMTGALSKLLGAGLLRDVQTFVAAMDTMFGGFRTRADATYRLLQAPGHGLPGGGGARAGRAARGRVLRGTAGRRPDAAGRAGAQPGARQRRRRLSAERALAAAENLEDPDRSAEDAASDRRPDPDPPRTPGPEQRGRRRTRRRSRTGRHCGADGAAGWTRTADGLAPGARRSTRRPPGRGGTARRRAAATARGPDAVLARERRTRDRFTSLHPEVPVAEVTALPGDVHDLEGLRTIGERLALDKCEHRGERRAGRRAAAATGRSATEGGRRLAAGVLTTAASRSSCQARGSTAPGHAAG